MTTDPATDAGTDPGDLDAHTLLPLVYRALHQVAEEHMRRQDAWHTLQPTALVHEAWLRMAQTGPEKRESWRSPSHFSCSAARTMRSVLVDHARRRASLKRQLPEPGVSPMDAFVELYEQRVDLLALDEALTALEARESRQARIVELHFFGGHTFERVAGLLGVSEATVKRDWRRAREWIRARVEGQEPSP